MSPSPIQHQIKKRRIDRSHKGILRTRKMLSTMKKKEKEETPPDLVYGPRAVLNCQLCERFLSRGSNLCMTLVLAGMSYEGFIEMLNEEMYWEAEVVKSFMILARHKHCHLGNKFDSESKTFFEFRQGKEEFDFTEEMKLPEQFDHVIMIMHTINEKKQGHFALVEFFRNERLIKIDESAEIIESKAYAPGLMKILKSYGWCKGNPKLKFPSLKTRSAGTSKPYAGWRVERAISESSTTLEQNDYLPDCGPIACTNFLNRIIPNFKSWPDKSPKVVRWSVVNHLLEIQKEVFNQGLFTLTYEEEGLDDTLQNLMFEIQHSIATIEESINALKPEIDEALVTSSTSILGEEKQKPEFDKAMETSPTYIPEERKQEAKMANLKDSQETDHEGLTEKKSKEPESNEKLKTVPTSITGEEKEENKETTITDALETNTGSNPEEEEQEPVTHEELETSLTSIAREEKGEAKMTTLKDSLETKDESAIIRSSQPDPATPTKESILIQKKTFKMNSMFIQSKIRKRHIMNRSMERS